MSKEQATNAKALWIAEPAVRTVQTMGCGRHGLRRPFTAMVHLIPSRTNYTAKDIAEMMFHEVYRLHGLNKLIGIRQKMSSAYHPETDGSTERANRTIGQMLRACIGTNQKDWVTRLPFFLNTGRMPRAMIWDSLLATRVKQTIQANKRRRMCPLENDDLVYISTKNINYPKGTSRKLVPKFIGPYRIIENFGNNSYGIELPDNQMMIDYSPDEGMIKSKTWGGLTANGPSTKS